MHKVIACRLEFIKTLVRKQHLAQSVVAVRASPWSLDSRDMSRFSYRGAQSCWGAEFMDLMRVVSE